MFKFFLLLVNLLRENLKSRGQGYIFEKYFTTEKFYHWKIMG